MSKHRVTALIAAAAFFVLPAACSSDSGGGDDQGTVMVQITEADGSVEADSDLVEAHTGQKIMFMVTTDAPDEIHVHSVPEHEFEVRPGPVQTFTFSVDTPGSVEVESHELDVTILKLQVS